MTFIRPELRRLAARWAETAAFAVATLAALGWLQGVAHDVYWRWGLSLAIAALGFWFIRAASLSALAASDEDGPGMVVIDERRIAYLGPTTGGFASINEICEIRLAPGPVWLLSHADEEDLAIPAGAEGAERILDAFSALPGFEAPRAVSALTSMAPAPVTIWRRPEGRVSVALAPNPPTA